MMTLPLLLLAALIGILAFWYCRSRADSNFENVFHEHIAPIADYCFCTKIPSHFAGVQDCTPMDILWLEYEANGRISVKASLGGPHLGHLNQSSANEIHDNASEECCWVPIFKRATRFGAEIVLVRLKIEPFSERLLKVKSRRP
jgi:hypothetical protein